MTPYKVQLVQELKSIDGQMLFRFAEWACVRLTEYANCCKKKKKNNFLAETHSAISGYVNKKNCGIWGTENTQAYIEK